MKSTLDYALESVQRGWPVFPLAPMTKVPPKGTHGYLDATMDEAEVRSWWKRWDEPNYGIATEAAGLVIIDIDVPKELTHGEDGSVREPFGIEAWCWMINNIGLRKEPRSFEVDTPSGGLHIYWQANKRLQIKTSTSKLAPGIDTKGVNGFITGPGSKTEKGTYERNTYKDPQPLPTWLRTLLRGAGLVTTEAEKRARTTTPPIVVSNGDNYANAALKGEIEQLRSTPIGAGLRNSELNKSAFKLRKYVDAGKLDGNAVADALYAVAVGDLMMNGNEAAATISSGLGLRLSA